MPRQFERSYNLIFREPDYFDEKQREKFLQRRILHEITEPALPPTPTRQMELDYAEQLEQELRGDKWLHFRFRKLHAGPLRHPYKKIVELKRKNKINWWINFTIGFVATTPFAIWVGRTNRSTSGGVARVYYPRVGTTFPNISPDIFASRYFLVGFFATACLGGYITSTLLANDIMRDDYYSRPDLKPTASMVEDTDSIKKAKEEL